MNQLQKIFLSLCLLAAFLGVTGCGPSARVDALRPAVVALPGVRALAVEEFTGPYGPSARECFLEEARSSQWFRLASWGEAQTGNGVGAGAGNEAGRVAVVRAEVSSSLQDRRGEDRRIRRTTESRVVTERDAHGDVVRTYTEDVPVEREVRRVYVRRTAEVEARMRVESGGRLLADERESEDFEERYDGGDCSYDRDRDRDHEWDRCGDRDCCDGWSDSSDRIPPARDTLEMLACSAGRELARRILPESYSVQVELDEDGGELVRQGAELADHESWAAAVELWRKALDANPRNAPALYNLGVEQERRGLSGNLQQARDYYRRAFDLDPKRLYGEALERIENRIRDEEELARRMS